MDRVLEKLGKYPCLEWAIALIPVVLGFMQQFDLCPGIFDIYDLVCYITPCAEEFPKNFFAMKFATKIAIFCIFCRDFN